MTSTEDRGLDALAYASASDTWQIESERFDIRDNWREVRGELMEIANSERASSKGGTFLRKYGPAIVAELEYRRHLAKHAVQRLEKAEANTQRAQQIIDAFALIAQAVVSATPAVPGDTRRAQLRGDILSLLDARSPTFDDLMEGLRS